jgi:putative ABC transport system ATP-binding protein
MSENESPAPQQPVIVLEGITKTYRMGDRGHVQAIRGVDLAIDSGDFVAIMGPSGSGKSSLMNILGCLDNPTSGRYRLGGIDVSGLNEKEQARIRNRMIGFVFQSFNLLARASALENVELPLVYRGILARERRKRALAALEAVGLLDWARHRPSELSGGQAQRVAIARALAMRPTLLLADEPTGNLDTRNARDILSTFGEIHRRGNTVLLVTHEEEVAREASRIVHIRDGRIESDERRAPHPAPPNDPG